MFAVGEVVLSPINGPLVNNLAPAALRGRYFAASAMCFTVAQIVSPAISGAAIGAGLGRYLLVFFVACCLAAAVGAHLLGNCLSGEQDNVAGSRQRAALGPPATENPA